MKYRSPSIVNTAHVRVSNSARSYIRSLSDTTGKSMAEVVDDILAYVKATRKYTLDDMLPKDDDGKV